MQKFLKPFVIAGSLFLGSCSITQLPSNLPLAIAKQTEPAVIEYGLPSYMILIDALIEGAPNNVNYRLNGARMYSLYATAFTQDKPALAARAFAYAKHASCIKSADKLCHKLNSPLEDFESALAQLKSKDLPWLYVLMSAWAVNIQAHSSDMSQIAQLPKIKALAKFILKQDESYENGNVHLVLAILESQLPPSLGGKPEVAKHHFKRAIAISKQQNLMAKVLYAKQYARMLYLKDLHQKLLHEVINHHHDAKELNLANALAKQQAAKLLATADEYFD